MPTKAQKGAAFIAALTAADQLTDNDKRAALLIRRETLWEAWQTATVAYHLAAATEARARVARLNHWPDRDALTAQHDQAARTLMVAIERYIRLPSTKGGDVREKAARLRECSKAISATTSHHWAVLRPRLRLAVEQEAAAYATKIVKEAR